MSISTEAIFHITGYSLAGIGLLVAVWALAVRDVRRSRRGPRCPKCWYDMRGAAAGGLVCPECGRDAGKAARLFKRRRHWRVVVLGVVVMAMGYGVWTTPRVRKTGWPGAVPTTAIIAALPWLDPVEERVVGWMTGSWSKTGVPSLLADELLNERIAKKSPWSWQTRLMAHRCVAGDSGRRACSQGWHEFYEPILDKTESAIRDDQTDEPPAWFTSLTGGVSGISIVCRESWPAGTPIYAYVSGPYRFAETDDTRWALEPVTPGLRSMGDVSIKRDLSSRFHPHMPTTTPWDDYLQSIGVIGDSTSGLEFVERFENGNAEHESWSVMHERPLRVPVRIIAETGRTPAEIAKTIVRPRESRSIGEAIAGKGKFKVIAVTDQRVDVAIDLEELADLLHHENTTLAFRAELLVNGDVVSHADVWWRAIEIAQRRPMLFPFLSPDVCVYFDTTRPLMDDPKHRGGTWSLRLTGDPVVALRDFDAKRYWDGQVTVPINVAPKGGSPGR